MNAVAYKGTSALALRARPSLALNPEIKISRAGLPGVLSINTPFWRRDAISSLIVVGAITCLFCVILLLGSLKHSVLPRVSEDDYLPITASAYAPSDKDAFLSRLNTQEKRKMAAQVHYVSEIIRSTRSDVNKLHRLAYAIVLESRKLDLDPFFVAAVIKSESAFNHKALSYAGAQGLMQLMPDTAKYISKRSALNWDGTARLKDPYYNIKLGTAYLKYLEEMFDGNREQMLIAYNWGPSNLIKALEQRSRVPGSTMKYARTIISDHARWKAEFAVRASEFSYLNLSNVG
ncbi:MAG: lytic transglycosylase domain-containing protein [Oligoflexia bacterium]|nr:lytic transglycosylase domain-containing protein [Oligoflexia bacterium]